MQGASGFIMTLRDTMDFAPGFFQIIRKQATAATC